MGWKGAVFDSSTLGPWSRTPRSKRGVTGLGKTEDPNDCGDHMVWGNAICGDSSRGSGVCMTVC